MSPSRAALVLLGGALALWFAFDRVWPRLPAWWFVRLELVLLILAFVAGAVGWTRDPDRVTRAIFGATLAGLMLFAMVAALRLRYLP